MCHTTQIHTSKMSENSFLGRDVDLLDLAGMPPCSPPRRLIVCSPTCGTSLTPGRGRGNGLIAAVPVCAPVQLAPRISPELR